MILITGDKELEMLARYEENAHLYASSKHWDKKPPSIRWRDLTTVRWPLPHVP